MSNGLDCLDLPTGSESILFVDDNEQLTDIAEQMLGALGYRLSLFTDGKAAIEHFAQDPEGYHLMITDLLMPGMNGIELCRAVKEIRPEIPVIVYTGNPNNISRKDREELGLHQILQKILLQPLQHLIDLKRELYLISQ